MNHIEHLRQEIDTLKSRVQEHDSGHLITAIRVLSKRVRELEGQSEEVLDSTYPDGNGYWK
jgi:hypothetical protein